MRPSSPPALLAAATVAAVVPAAFAADQPLPTLTVTAKGYAADALETPAATAIVPQDEIAARGASQPGDVLRGVPGLAVAADSAQGQNPVIRGLKRESVVLLVDGVRLNSAQPAGAIASFMALPLAERVEVVKGGASVLHGTGALGGVIQVLTPQARFEDGVRARLGASYDSASAGVRGTGVVNAAHGDHALMVGASLARIDDYRAPTGTVPRTGYDSGSFIGQYRFRIDGSQQLRVSLQQHTDRDVWYPGSTRPNANPQIGSTTVYAPEQSRRLAEVGYTRQGAGQNPLNLDLRVYRQDMERQIFSRANGPLARDNAQTRVTFATVGADARADWLIHPAHLLSFGLNAWTLDASPERMLASPPAFNLGRSDPFRDGEIRARGIFVQDDMRFGRLNVVAGLRHDTVTGDAAAVAGNASGALRRSDRATAGHLAAIYELTPLARPYASLARAFRAGEMRERFEASPRGDGYYYLGNPQIRPETADQFELGVKGADEAFSYRVAAYHNRIRDYITGRVTGATISGMPVKQTENIGSATLRGLEAEARWRVAAGHWLLAGASLVRGTNGDYDEPLFQMPADELDLGWEGALAAGWRGDATLRLVRRQDRVATRFTNGAENPTAGFVTLDLGVSYRWNRQRLRVALKNLADKAYHEHLTEGVSGSEIRAPGRSLLVSWSGDF